MNRESAPAHRPKIRIRESRFVGRLYDIPAPSLELARVRMRCTPGLFQSLSDEARKLWDNYDGPENIGPPS